MLTDILAMWCWANCWTALGLHCLTGNYNFLGLWAVSIKMHMKCTTGSPARRRHSTWLPISFSLRPNIPNKHEHCLRCQQVTTAVDWSGLRAPWQIRTLFPFPFRYLMLPECSLSSKRLLCNLGESFLTFLGAAQRSMETQSYSRGWIFRVDGGLHASGAAFYAPVKLFKFWSNWLLSLGTGYTLGSPPFEPGQAPTCLSNETQATNQNLPANT